MEYFFVLTVYILVCYGISNMVVFANGPFGIFEKWRTFTDNINHGLGELFSCMLCFPMWVGMALSAIDLFILTNQIFTPCNMILSTGNDSIFIIVLIILLDGALASGTSWIIHNIEEYFES